MDAFTRLKKNLKNDFSGLQPVRVAVLGDTSTQWLVQAIRGAGYERGFDLRILEADFNQVEREVFDASSALYAFDPQVIILYQSSQRLLDRYNRMIPAARPGLASDRMTLVDSLRAAIRSHSAAAIFYYNYPEIDDGVFGSYANKTEASFLFQLRVLNVELMRYAAGQEGFYVCDLSAVQQRMGRSLFFRAAVYIITEMDASMDALPVVAEMTVALVAALFGQVKKCLILDLDNTLWGGVIGDDGMENIRIGALGRAFTDFQYWVKKLKDRGILLAVASKNTEAVARQPFESHPDMVLRLEDFAVFIANWETKVDNIRRIQAVLNIGYDSMVFLDDNPFERSMVREALPAVTVPDLPEDPAEFQEYLYTLQLFETASAAAGEEQRTKWYQLDQERMAQRSVYTDEETWLRGLDMVSRVEAFNRWNAPRVAQLSQRSNQFNLRTVRYTDAEILERGASAGWMTFAFTLDDRFGDNGIICVVMLEDRGDGGLFIDTWLMSCRVLRRGMENFTLNTIVAAAREKGFRYLFGEYLPTAKNQLVSEHYSSLGFTDTAGGWLLELNGYQERPTPVRRG
jgi:FkbH-like protein